MAEIKEFLERAERWAGRIHTAAWVASGIYVLGSGFMSAWWARAHDLPWPLMALTVLGGIVAALLALALSIGAGYWLWKKGRAYVAGVAARKLSRQQQAMVDALKGVGHFFYFALTSDKPVGNSPAGSPLYQWYTIAPKGIVRELNYWISPSKVIGGKTRDDSYMSLDFRKPALMTIHGGSFASDRVFPEGEYLIEFDDSNWHWDEWLTVYTKDGKLRQHILVKSGTGETLHETTDDRNFSTP
jgi:hypothetical protein